MEDKYVQNKKATIFLMIAVALSILMIASGISLGKSTGPPSGTAKAGCGACHNPDPSIHVEVLIDGLPDKYEPGKTYTITVKLNVNWSIQKNGGFALETSGGEFSVPDVHTQITGAAKQEAKHKEPNAVNWTLNWTAPKDTKIKSVTFNVAGNAVNGDRINNTDDLWNTAVITIPAVESETPDDDKKDKDNDQPGFLAMDGIVALSIALAIIIMGSRFRTGNEKM